MRYFIPNRLGRFMIFVVMALVIIPALLLAQVASDTASVALPVVNSWQDALVWLIPFLVPFVIMLVKKWLYSEEIQPDGSIDLIPPKWLPGWMLPVLAPVIGMVASYMLYVAGAGAGSALTGALLGAAGVCLREIFKPITTKRLAADPARAAS